MKKQSGQAMVEFVIFLTVVMALCIGMLVTKRLLSFQFWAQQDARYLAYEQTWSAREYYDNSGEEPIDLHAAGVSYGGPKQLNRITSIRRTSEGDRASSILSWLLKDRINFLEKGSEELSLVNTAYAKQLTKEMPDRLVVKNNKNIKQTKLEINLQGFLEKADFAKRACSRLENFSKNKKINLIAAFKNCEETLNSDFAKQLSRTLDFKNLLKQYQLRLENGDKPAQAIKDTVQLAATEQYFSLFDNKVKDARVTALAEIASDTEKAIDSLEDSSVNKMLDEARYVSSAEAVQGIIDVADAVHNPNAPNAAELEKDHAVFFGAFLFADAKDQFDESPYDFNFSYLPVPRSFGSEGIRMQEVVMSSILDGDGDLSDSLINKSAKSIEVNYRAKHGLFPAAAKWLSSASEVELTAKHYLITQPWHVTRRNGLGDYRSKGTQDDSADESTEEGILRRRTFGLWLYPSEFNYFASPIFNLAGLEEVGSVLSLFEPFDTLLNELKKGLVKNPFRSLVDALNQLPGIDKFKLVLPQVPAVRPDAYPKSKELSGNEIGTPDKMIQGKVRDFKDYVDEQRELNPAPDPEYN